MPLTDGRLIVADGPLNGQGYQPTRNGPLESDITNAIAGLNSLISITGSFVTNSAGSTGSFVKTFTVADLIGNNLIVYHNLNEKNVIAYVYNDNDLLDIPSEIQLIDENSIKITFPNVFLIQNTWRVVVVAGGITQSQFVALSGAMQNQINLLSQLLNSRYITTFNSIDLVAGVLNVNHNLNDTYITVSVYNDTNRIVLPSEVSIIDKNNVQLNFVNYQINGIWKVIIFSGNSVGDIYSISGSNVSIALLSNISGNLQYDIDNKIGYVDLVSISSNLIPSLSGVYSLGTSGMPWKDLYLTGNSIYLGNNRISVDNNGFNINGNTIVDSSNFNSFIAISGLLAGVTTSMLQTTSGDLQTEINTINRTRSVMYARTISISSDNILPTDELVRISGASILYMPPISACLDGQTFIIKDINHSGSSNVSVLPCGGDTIDASYGESNKYVLTSNKEVVTLVSNTTTTNWEFIG